MAPKTGESRPNTRGSAPSAQPSFGEEGAAAPTERVEDGDVPRDMWKDCIQPQMKNIVLWSLRTVMESVEHRKNSVELFGYDFMFSEEPGKDPKVWLIEVNSSPAMDYSTPITTPLVKKVMEDTAKVLVDLRDNPNADTGEWELMAHDADKQAVTRPIATGKMELVGTRIEAPKRRFKKKKKKKAKLVESQAEAAPSEDKSKNNEEDEAKEDDDEDEADAGAEENDEDCDEDEVQDGEDDAASGEEDDDDDDDEEEDEDELDADEGEESEDES